MYGVRWYLAKISYQRLKNIAKLSDAPKWSGHGSWFNFCALTSHGSSDCTKQSMGNCSYYSLGMIDGVHYSPWNYKVINHTMRYCCQQLKILPVRRPLNLFNCNVCFVHRLARQNKRLNYRWPTIYRLGEHLSSVCMFCGPTHAFLVSKAHTFHLPYNVTVTIVPTATFP